MTWWWLDQRALLLLDDESLAEHGGAPGIRDSVCSSRQSRAPKLAANGTPDFAELAASYAIGLANNHAFVDGNKRAALLVTGLFLYLNGYKLTVSQADATMTVFFVAAGEMIEAGFADWLRRHGVKL